MRRRLRGTWDQLKKHPTELMRRVADGRAIVVGKDKFGRLIYQLKAK